MDFGFSDEYTMVQKMYRDFAEKEIKPIASEIDETERFPKENVEKMAKMGMLGIPFPEAYGGEEGDHLSYVFAVEELSKVCASTGVTLSAHTSLCAAPIYDWGTEEQKQKYLTRLASGACLGAFGLTEPNAGTDASRQRTTAIREGSHAKSGLSGRMGLFRAGRRKDQRRFTGGFERGQAFGRYALRAGQRRAAGT